MSHEPHRVAPWARAFPRIPHLRVSLLTVCGAFQKPCRVNLAAGCSEKLQLGNLVGAFREMVANMPPPTEVA